MASKIFITGTTGYIGGDILYILHKNHPDWSFTALVRNEEKAEQVTKAYPNVRTVIGDLDRFDLIKEESAKADIVIHTADSSDHEGSAMAIASGLASGHSPKKPGYWIHTSGTGILTYLDSDADRFGESSDKIYDDLDKVDELTHLPDHAFHRNIDKIILEVGITNADRVKTVIVCPPTIYGPGRGPCSGRSRQVYELARITLSTKKAPVIGAGKSIWDNVHIHDLSDLYLALAEAAAEGNNDNQIWGANGYFLAENGEHVWGDISKVVAEVAAKQGYIPAAELQSMNKDEAFKVADFQALSWGLNSRGRARRARKLLNWSPSAPSLLEEIPRIVQSEWERLER